MQLPDPEVNQEKEEGMICFSYIIEYVRLGIVNQQQVQKSTVPPQPPDEAKTDNRPAPQRECRTTQTKRIKGFANTNIEHTARQLQCSYCKELIQLSAGNHGAAALYCPCQIDRIDSHIDNQ